MLSTVLSGGAHSPEGRVWAQYGQRGGVMQGRDDHLNLGRVGRREERFPRTELVFLDRSCRAYPTVSSALLSFFFFLT